MNRIVACVHSIWRHYKQRCNLYVERGYSWFRYGGTVIRPQEIKNIMRDTGTAHLMAISGFTSLLQRCWLPDSFAVDKFFSWALDPLANAINWRNLLCCFYAWLTGMQPPAFRTVVALATGECLS